MKPSFRLFQALNRSKSLMLVVAAFLVFGVLLIPVKCEVNLGGFHLSKNTQKEWIAYTKIGIFGEGLCLGIGNPIEVCTNFGLTVYPDE